MAGKKKFYVVWEGRHPGIYEEWSDALEQVENFKGAKYKSYTSLEAATEAFRSGDGRVEADLGRLLIHEADMAEKAKKMAKAAPRVPAYMQIPEVDKRAIAVDAACSGNPGDMEYRGVDLSSGRELFHMGPLAGGTNNIGEYLAIVHALALCAKKGVVCRIYSDSKTGMAWIRRRHSNTAVKPDGKNAKVLELLARADAWVASHTWRNQITKWDTDNWGEIPADFGRK